jgi:hypothetical protein
MNNVKGFDAQRCFLLIRNELFLGRGKFLIFAAVVWGVLLLNLVIRMNVPQNATILGPSYGIFIFISGLIIFDKTFKDLHHENKSAAWLTLPASLFEKYVSGLLFSITLSVAGIIILFSLFYIISEGILLMLFGSFNTAIHFDMLNKDIILRTARCIILMSPFQLGYIYFRKNAYGKTFLSLIVYLAALSAIFIVTQKIFFPDVFHGVLSVNFPPQPVPNISIENNALAKFGEILKWSAGKFFWFLLAPLCWVTGYIRLKEKEI